MSFAPAAAAPATVAGGELQPLSAGSNEAAKSTLWMGELEPWMDENFIKGIYASHGETVNVKVIRDKNSG
jgi:hypothetical protein